MPTPAIPTNQDFADRRRKMLPPGQAWAWSVVGDKLLLGFSDEQIRFRQALNSFLLDILPQTTINLLQEWQESVSLPDECSDSLTTNDRDEVLARLRNRGAESVEQYEALFPGSTVVEYFISYVDIMQVDDELVDDFDWQHTWVLEVPEELAGLTFATVDETQVDDPIEDFGTGFTCAANKEFSAHHFVFIEIIE